MMIKLWKGDCLERMKDIPDGSIDLILTDPPYNLTSCKWDSLIPFEPLWEHLKRVSKDNGAILLFGIEPFSSYVRMSNIEQYKYDWIWIKSRKNGFINAKNAPLRKHENIHVFSKGNTANNNKNRMCYYPQGITPHNEKKKSSNVEESAWSSRPSRDRDSYISQFKNYPDNIITFNSEAKPIHPTQKPIPLLEYLIKTYTLESEVVLDFTAGSFSTGVACLNTGRSFIGIEKDSKYFKLGKNRMLEHKQRLGKNKLFSL